MKTILVPVDFNPLAGAALEHAALFAKVSGASLLVLYADTFAPPAEFTAGQTAALADALADSRTATAEALDEYARARVPEGVSFRTEVCEALPATGILSAIARNKPDLVVMGTHGRGGLSRLMFGSVTETVLRSTNTPLLTINRVDVPRAPRDILCVLTGNATNAVERAAADIASIFGAKCRSVHTSRDAAAEIVSLPESMRADLLVIGEDIHAITRRASCPVLHVRV
jgi:nucleotide-binding universal stress UspA family protein